MKTSSLNLPEEAVLEDAKTKLDLARECLSDLASMGISQPWLDQFQTSILAYEALPSDDTLLSHQKALTATKDQTLRQAEQWGNLLRDRCKLAYRATPHNPFPNSSFRAALHNESKMLLVLPSLIAIASSHVSVLISLGQPADYASQGQALRDQLDQLNRQQEKAKLSRRIATANRRRAIQTVYESLMYLNTAARATYRGQPHVRELFKTLSHRVATPASESPQTGP